MNQSLSPIEAGKVSIGFIKWLYYQLYEPTAQLLERKSIYFRAETRKLQESLFPALFYDISSDVGTAHEKYSGKIHPDNRVATEEISNSLTAIFNRGREIKKFENYRVPDPERNLILIGSPKSTLLTREAMGYQKESEKLAQEPETGLRFVFNFDEKELSTCKRKIAGELHETPNYVIIDRDGKLRFRPPRTDDYDRLIEDYLLLTVMSNNLAQKHKNKDIINPSGVHGIGTRAFSLLLKNKAVLEKIDKEREQYRYYQSIIKITKVEQTEGYYLPKEIEHILTVPVETEIF
jgi:hypothetical protein